MRRSFGGGNKGMGGGNGGGGGGMLRSVASAVTRARVGGLQEPFSSSSSNTTTTTTTNTTGSAATSSTTKNRTAHKPNSTNLFSLSSSSLSSSSSSSPSPFSSHTLPLSGNLSLPNWPHCDEFEWVSVDGSEDSDVERVLHHGFFDDFVLGSVPSIDEVQIAVSALQQAQLVRDMYGVSSDRDAGDHITSPPAFGSELDWIEPAVEFCNSRTLQPLGSHKVYDAFDLLQTDKTVQRMVISLSSDKAVWDAVLNNEAVRELKESLDSAEDYSLPSSEEGSDGSDATMSIVKWIFDSTKAKATELIQTVMNIVNHLFQPSETETEEKTGAATDPFEEKLRSSFLLTVVVILIVVVSRVHRA